MKYVYKLILLLLVYAISFPIHAQIIDTTIVGSERNYGIIGSPNSNYIWGATDAIFVGNTNLPSVRVIWAEPSGLKPIWVIEQNEIGCFSDTIWAYVYVKEHDTVYTANAFTPNGDGLNDYFTIQFDPKIISSYSLSIYNRWGVLVFESTKQELGWDGTSLQAPCDIGVYIWYLQLVKKSGASINKKGFVTIIR
ncbi:MAG: gliding motility-associated C-terminal domain-containing protein [Sphaerospermopsis sp.]|nr:gliding motility-associated C-terminal domain-containing protein [Sphaerospermopsis sp.]